MGFARFIKRLTMKKLLITIALLLTFTLANCQLAGIIASQDVAASGGYPEMITNGDMSFTLTAGSTGDGWVTGTSWSVGSGVASFDDINNYSGLYQNDASMVSSIATNTNYTLEFDVSNASTYLRINWVSADQGVNYIIDGMYANGHHSLDFTSPANIGVGGIRARTYTSGSSGDVDNISLKQR